MTPISDITKEFPLSMQWLDAEGAVLNLPPGVLPSNVTGLHWRSVDPTDEALIKPSDVFTVFTDWSQPSSSDRSVARPTGKPGTARILAEGNLNVGRPAPMAVIGYADVTFTAPEARAGRVVVGEPRPIPQI